VTHSRRAVVVLTATLAVALAACSSGSDDKKATPESTAGPTTTTAPPVAPLTGLPDPSGQSRSRPVLWVKVENLQLGCVRPQSGLENADVVYDEVVEGGITRFLVAFNSTVPDVVGPIRSVRLTDPNLVWPLGGVFAYSGGAQPAVEAINQAPVNAVDESNAGDAMFRDSSRGCPRTTEHHLFGRGADLFAKDGKPVPPPALFEYLATGETFAGEPASEVTVGLMAGYAPTYTYDAGSNTWTRAIDGVPFTMKSGVQIAPTNVIVQFIDYVGGAGIEGAEGTTVGEGDAWIFSGGQVIRGRWIRPNKEQPARYVDAAGKSIKLAPGKTWVELPQIGTAVNVVQPPPAAATTAPKG
jgi:hypothetical protein